MGRPRHRGDSRYLSLRIRTTRNLFSPVKNPLDDSIVNRKIYRRIYIYIFFEIYRYNNIFTEEKEYVFLSTVYNDNLLYIFLSMNID